jgi:hypothetical protein
MPLTVFAGIVFFILVLLGSGTVEPVIRGLAQDSDMPAWVVVLVPALFGGLYAMLLYQGAARREIDLSQCSTRAAMVAVLTWISVAGFITFIWSPAEGMWETFKGVLALMGVVAGGPLLMACLLGGGAVYYALERRFGAIRYDD